MKASIVCISGPDGVGKSKLTDALVADLMARNARVRRVRLRFPVMLSAPLIVYARLRGYYDNSEDQAAVGPGPGVRAYHRSSVLRSLFPWTQLIDGVLMAFVKAWLPRRLGYTVICDRFLPDVLSDALTATNRPFDAEGRLERSFGAILSGMSIEVVVVDAPWDEVLRRRKQEETKAHWDRTHVTCLVMAAALGCPVVDNTGDFANSLKELQRSVSNVAQQ